jgi:aryl-alcohol dehydrogenase-like predicted oxidoreductase
MAMRRDASLDLKRELEVVDTHDGGAAVTIPLAEPSGMWSDRFAALARSEAIGAEVREEPGGGVLQGSPLARGLLAGNRTREGERLTTRARTDAWGDSLYTPEADFTVVDRVAEIAAERKVPAAHVALAWLLHKPGVTAPIVGATKPDHLDDAVAAEQLALSADEIARLEEPYVPHTISGHS